MLALGLVLAGASVTAVIAAIGAGQEVFVPAVALTVAQLAVALAYLLNLVGARVAAIVVLLLQLAALLFVASVLLLVGALPLEGGGPLPGHPFNPVLFAAIVAAVVVMLAMYLLAVRSAWRHSQQQPVMAAR